MVGLVIFLMVSMDARLSTAQDLYQYPKSNRFGNFFQHRANNKFIDIYTNHPDEDEVVRHYYSAAGEHPDQKNRRHYSSGYNGMNYNRGFHNNHDSKFKDVMHIDYNDRRYGEKLENKDELHSDFGLFEHSDEDNKYAVDEEEFLAILKDKYGAKNHSQPFEEGFKKRPKFKTKKPGSNVVAPEEDLPLYYATIQKVKIPQKKASAEETFVRRLNEMLKKQLVKIQSKNKGQKQPQPDEEVEDLVAESTDLDYEEQGQDPAPVESDVKLEEGQIVDQNAVDHSKFLDVPLKNLKNKTIKLANKFLSLFTIIQFPNSRCQATSASSDYEGYCFHRTECFKRNGTAIGFCASGYGVCCVDRHSCGGGSNKNCTYFESPGYPNYFPMNGSVVLPLPTTTTVRPPLTPDPRIKTFMFEYARQEDISLSLSCTFRVSKATPTIRQMRIDFLDLELRGPTNGTCAQERLIISGQNINGQIPVLCGYNTGQHVYVDVANMVGPLQLSILSNTVERKRHRIRICQYEGSCDNSLNCLQYYTGVQGTVTSFNYEQSATFSRSTPGYLNNLNYGVCIRREAGYCSVTYRNVQNNIEFPFQLVNYVSSGVTTVPVGQAGAEIFNCPDDFIVINGIRLCGYKLNDGSSVPNFQTNAPVTDVGAGPIIVTVRTDAANATGRGFKLFYTQNPCT